MKSFLAAILGTMAIGGTVSTAVAYDGADLPKWQASVDTFKYTLKNGTNFIELSSGNSVVVEKSRGGTLYAWATTGEQRRALADGDYAIANRPGINECTVSAGVIE